ncbi:hypothetical protein O3W44_14125 [Pantoea sp. LMR881]|uniref:hypothetical protein n=1 Tax=Pantoea sp. LMR881 TaxID=3014336 RepID=UPI0022AE72D4|nr:hypothetical protein [Pantoea sp. LMR881]MCZ4059984.1 hypothetical protein [Pantoea sp. LMR881]
MRDEADRSWDRVRGEMGSNRTLESFQKSMDIAMHLLFLSIEKVRDQEVTDPGEAMVKDAVFAQTEYLKAGADLTLKMVAVGDNTP